VSKSTLPLAKHVAVSGKDWRSREGYLQWLCVLPLTTIFAGLLLYDLLGASRVTYGRDGFHYLYPAMKMVSSTLPPVFRELGYPSFLAGHLLILPLAKLPWTQAGIVVAGICAGGYCLARSLRGLPVPRWVKIGACALAFLFFICIVALNDGFIVFIFWIGPEAIHSAILLWALAALTSFPATRPWRSAVALCALAFLLPVATFVRPHSVILTMLAGASFAVLCLLRFANIPRAFALTGLVVFVLFEGAFTTINIRFEDKYLTTMAERSFFCNHEDLMRATLETSSAIERRAVAKAIGTITSPTAKTIHSADAVLCMYNADMDRVIAAAAAAERVSEVNWLRTILIEGIAAQPILYGTRVVGEYRQYFRDPLGPFEVSTQSPLELDDWQPLRLEFPKLAPSDQDFRGRAGNEIANGDNNPLKYVKYLIYRFRRQLSIIGGFAVLVALAEFGYKRGRAPVARLLITASIFLLANIGTVAVSNKFEVVRYALALVPLYAIWLSAGCIYILTSVYLLAVAAVGRFERTGGSASAVRPS
jgi:hypothetical protein